mmetsp:Transcript_2334/g.6314  ORF Transcript_2334/g.6314 Transcript_2334/m.6314 type:complete len:89 (+) Transcript_2334:1053-1319(+)
MRSLCDAVESNGNSAYVVGFLGRDIQLAVRHAAGRSSLDRHFLLSSIMVLFLCYTVRMYAKSLRHKNSAHMHQTSFATDFWLSSSSVI